MSDTDIACHKHKDSGFQGECNLCMIEKEALGLVEQWEEGEDIPQTANSRALEMLEWRIIRKALVIQVEQDANKAIAFELGMIRKLLAIIALRAGDLERISENVSELAVDVGILGEELSKRRGED